MSSVAVGQRDRVDLWLAFAAGPDHWIEVRDDDPVLDMGPRMVFVGSLSAAASWTTIWLLTGTARIDRREVVLLAMLVVAIVTWSSMSLTRARQRHRTSVGRAVMERVVLGGATVVCAAGLTTDVALLGLFPLGVAAGADISLTGNALGIPLAARYWTTRFLVSPAHVGVLVVLAGAGFVLGLGSALARLVLLYLTFLVCIGAAALTVAVFNRLIDRYRARLRDVEERTIEHEHRLRGHWLHDDVCADLRSVRLRLEAVDLSPADVAGLLDDLDHQLRVRQLDEFLSTGHIRLAEVVQPYLRRAQQEGVVVTASPSIETAGVTVPAGCGRLIQRAIAVLVANAVQAGSPWLAVRLQLDERTVRIEVEDAAGGFDLDHVPMGRGLDRLRTDLGEGNLTAARTTHGSIISARVPRSTS